jgi:hypothetical protein
MKTLLIAVSFTSIVSILGSVYKLVEPVPTALRGSRCAAVCDCSRSAINPDGSNNAEGNKSCVLDNGRGTNCATYCSQ